MLQISELRIGNYFLADGMPQTLSAISVMQNNQFKSALIGFYVDNKLQHIPADSEQLQPMPITDDILEKCGFKFDNYFKRWQKNKKVFGSGVDMELDSDYTALDFSGRPVLKEIQHVHQLQNLYYALKRVEMMVDVRVNEKMKAYANNQ